MKDKPSIKKIVFNVNGKTLELSKDEAKELKDILSDLFGEKETVYVDRWHPTYPSWRYPHWTYMAGGTLAGQSGTMTGATTNTATDTIYLNAASCPE
jgi:hypothetical protein